MVVHVKLRVKSKRGCSEELVVLANGGAHSPEPVLVVDEEVARRLGYTGGEVVEASVADARREVYLVREALELELLGEGGEVLSGVGAHLVIHPNLEEPLITDVTIDELGISVLSFSKGLWRHSADPPSKVRRSAAV